MRISLISLFQFFIFITKLESHSSKLCYGVVIDAGSSSTKLYAYSWNCRESTQLSDVNLISLIKDIKYPGLSTFGKKLDKIDAYFQVLINKASSCIPQEMRKYTPIMLGATAGMRIISTTEQESIMAQVRSTLRNSGFLFENEFAKIITGEEEGKFLWISVNYLQEKFNSDDDYNSNSNEYSTVIELGGASTQIAFTFQSNSTNQQQSQDKNVSFYSKTNQYYGDDLAREKVTYMSHKQSQKNFTSGCYNSGYTFTNEITGITFTGKSDPYECIEQIKVFLNATQCSNNENYVCSLNRSLQPPIPKQSSIIAVSRITRIIQAFNFSSKFKPSDLLAVSIEFCKIDYNQAQLDDYVNKYFPEKCFLGLYSALLLMDGYKLDNYLIFSPNKIRNNEPQWAIGFLFSQITYCSQFFSNETCKSLKKIFWNLI